MDAMRIEGTIHPRPPLGGSRARAEVDDLTSAEIRSLNLGYNRSARENSTPMWIEHDPNNGEVGKVVATWCRPDGSMGMRANVTDERAKDMVRSGEMRGLSIDSSIQHHAGRPFDGRLTHNFTEVSLTTEPRRPGCYIHEIDGQPCVVHATASASGASLNIRFLL